LSVVINLLVWIITPRFPNLLGGNHVPGSFDDTPLIVLVRELNYPVVIIERYLHGVFIRSYLTWTDSIKEIYDIGTGLFFIALIFCYWFLLGNVIAYFLKVIIPLKFRKHKCTAEPGRASSA
jgi:hypothetical protein